MTILGAPISLSGEVAPIVAEMQGRARRAFHAHKSCAPKAPFKNASECISVSLGGPHFGDAPPGPSIQPCSKQLTARSSLKVRTMTAAKRLATESWQDWNIRTMRRARALLHHHKFLRWSTHALELQWNLWGYIGRAPFSPTFHLLRWRDLAWWRDQQSLPPGPAPRGVRHIGHHNPDRDPERHIGAIAGLQWWILAADRNAWQTAQKVFSSKNLTPLGQADTKPHCRERPTLLPTRAKTRRPQHRGGAAPEAVHMPELANWWREHGLIRD